MQVLFLPQYLLILKKYNNFAVKFMQKSYALLCTIK